MEKSTAGIIVDLSMGRGSWVVGLGHVSCAMPRGVVGGVTPTAAVFEALEIVVSDAPFLRGRREHMGG